MSNLTASYNTAVGYQAGYTSTTAQLQTCVGYQAGYGSTGSSNTFIGNQSGVSMTSGAKNTFLGAYNGNQLGLDLRTASNYIVLSDGDGNPRGIFDGSGNFLVGQTATNFANSRSFVLDVGAGALYVSHANGDASGNYFAGFGYNGSAIGSITQSGTTAVLYNITSDQRLKTNIVDAPSGNINNIKVRSFDWVTDGNHQTYGLVAQELLEVAPYAVHQPQNSEEMMAVDYSKLVPMMIKEIQDLKARLTTLENK
jgi:hypothetical protein